MTVLLVAIAGLYNDFSVLNQIYAAADSLRYLILIFCIIAGFAYNCRAVFKNGKEV